MNDHGGTRPTNAKTGDLESEMEDGRDAQLTTNQGVRIADNHNSLTAGDRGPTLLEDFIFREKMTHFDHERIPERVAPGASGARCWRPAAPSWRC
jgi:catalase